MQLQCGYARPNSKLSPYEPRGEALDRPKTLNLDQLRIRETRVHPEMSSPQRPVYPASIERDRYSKSDSCWTGLVSRASPNRVFGVIFGKKASNSAVVANASLKRAAVSDSRRRRPAVFSSRA